MCIRDRPGTGVIGPRADPCGRCPRKPSSSPRARCARDRLRRCPCASSTAAARSPRCDATLEAAACQAAPRWDAGTDVSSSSALASSPRPRAVSARSGTVQVGSRLLCRSRAVQAASRSPLISSPMAWITGTPSRPAATSPLASRPATARGTRRETCRARSTGSSTTCSRTVCRVSARFRHQGVRRYLVLRRSLTRPSDPPRCLRMPTWQAPPAAHRPSDPAMRRLQPDDVRDPRPTVS